MGNELQADEWFAYVSLRGVGRLRRFAGMPGEDEIQRAREEDSIGDEFG